MFDKFKKILRNPRFACNHAWEMKKAVDKGECVSALFMDLSKAFDTINHDLLLAKLKAYGFSLNAVELMGSYLNKQKTTGLN